MRPLRLALLTILQVALLAWCHDYLDPPGPWGRAWLELATISLVVLAGHVAVHEVGHLVGALAVRLPVTGIRLFGMTMGRVATPAVNAVGTRPPVRLVAPRMAAFFLAGPLANLAWLAVLPRALEPTRSPTERAWWITAAIWGVVIGLVNLVPVTAVGRSDGSQLLDLLLRRSQARFEEGRQIERLRSAYDRADRSVGRRQ